MTHSNGQCQGHAHFDNEYLGNGCRFGKNYDYHQIASHIASFRYLYLTLANSKVIVQAMHIFTANNLDTVTRMANITIAVK